MATVCTYNPAIGEGRYLQIAVMFPGQGSQSVGMLAELAAAAPAIQQTFAAASTALGYDLWQLCQQGPEEALAKTERTQPAMLAAGIAALRAWEAAGGASAVAMAGHSLGEYSALVAAGAVDFADAVKLVRLRGELMQRAVPAGTGAMAAILGLDDAVIEAACAEAAQGEVVQPVNYNSPGQLVIAGHAAAVARAIEACKAKGAKRAVLLPVSVPSHSALMKPAADALRPHLELFALQVERSRVVMSRAEENVARSRLDERAGRLARSGRSDEKRAAYATVRASIRSLLEDETDAVAVGHEHGGLDGLGAGAPLGLRAQCWA